MRALRSTAPASPRAASAGHPGADGERPRKARALAEALWFPLVLFLGFLFCFAPAMHAPHPDHVKLAVVGTDTAREVSAELGRAYPGGFDVHAVADPAAARQAVLDRSAVGGYASAQKAGQDAVLYATKADGGSLETAISTALGPVAAADGAGLRVDETVATLSQDPLGSISVYFGIAWSVPGYILSTTLLRAFAFDRRRKLLVIAGTAALFGVIGFVVGNALGYLPANPAIMGVSFLLTVSVATFASGLAAFTRQFFPALGMGLFIVASIPSSGGAVPAPLLPPVFQFLHSVLPLGNAVDALRGVLYFGGAGTLRPLAVLGAWIAVGAALMGLDALRRRRAQTVDDIAEPPVDDPALETPVPVALPGHRHHFGDAEPQLLCSVRDGAGTPIAHAVLAILDPTGRQLLHARTDAAGELAAAGLPEGPLTLVATAHGRVPAARRVALHPGAILHADLVLGDAPADTARPADATRLAPATA